MMRNILGPMALTAGMTLGASGAWATTILLDQDFENPNSYSSTFDVDSRSVNTLYGNQPAGFTFGNTHTVETVNVTDSVNPLDGQRSFDSIGGYTGDLATSGNFVIGMLSGVQNDRLGLTFNVGTFDFLNFQIDVTSLDLDCCGAPFMPFGGTTPTFRFSLFEDSGGSGIGAGTLLDWVDLTGTASNRNVLDFTRGTFGLDAKDSVDGIVTLQIDLLSGGYAAFDNLRIAASDTEGDVGGEIPLPASGWLLLGGLALLRSAHRRYR